MDWVETTPGHWQRPIGENEAMIKMIGDGGQKYRKEVWSISVTANFAAHLKHTSPAMPLHQALGDGWKVLRFRHPSISTTTAEDVLEYDVPDLLQLDRWMAETFITVDGQSGPDDIIARLTPRRFATLYYLVEDVSVVLNLSHWRTDGIGAFHLLNAYFQAVVEAIQKDPGELEWGEETSRLVPSVEYALKLPSKPSMEVDLAAKQFLGTFAHNVGALATPYKSGDDIAPGSTRFADLDFPQDDTTEIQIRCRHLGILLESAVHASVAATAYAIAEPKSKQRYHSSTLRHSIRPHLPAPYNGIAGAAGLYTAGYIVKVPASQTWIENAKQYDAEYKKGATDELLSSRRQYAVLTKELLKNIKVPNPPPSGLDFSYVPVAQALVHSIHTSAAGPLEVLDIGISVEVLSRHLYVFVWTFNGRLRLRLVYNEAFYSKLLTENILTLVKKSLISNLHSS